MEGASSYGLMEVKRGPFLLRKWCCASLVSDLIIRRHVAKNQVPLLDLGESKEAVDWRREVFRAAISMKIKATSDPAVCWLPAAMCCTRAHEALGAENTLQLEEVLGRTAETDRGFLFEKRLSIEEELDSDRHSVILIDQCKTKGKAAPGFACIQFTKYSDIKKMLTRFPIIAGVTCNLDDLQATKQGKTFRGRYEYGKLTGTIILCGYEKNGTLFAYHTAIRKYFKLPPDRSVENNVQVLVMIPLM